MNMLTFYPDDETLAIIGAKINKTPQEVWTLMLWARHEKCARDREREAEKHRSAVKEPS
jgi:hypothetical protein